MNIGSVQPDDTGAAAIFVVVLSDEEDTAFLASCAAPFDVAERLERLAAFHTAIIISGSGAGGGERVLADGAEDVRGLRTKEMDDDDDEQSSGGRRRRAVGLLFA